MRALMVIAEMGSGGAETVVSDLARHLVSLDHGVTVASSGGFRAEELPGHGVRSLRVPLRTPGPVGLARTAARLRLDVRRSPVDVVHAHNVRATLAAHLGTRWPRRRPPVLTTVHGLADDDYARAVPVLNRCADLVVAVSADVGERLTSAGLEAGRLHVVENACRPVPSYDRARARRELGLDPDRPVVLCLARLAAPKRHDLLVAAWERVPRDAVLLVAGDGPGQADLAGRVARAGLAGRVRLLGVRQDVPRLLAASDVMVLASDREGMPMTVLEAMSAGVPVVASAVGGLVSLGDDALALVAPGSAEALAEGLSAVLGDATRRRAMAAAATELLGRRFSSAGLCSSYEYLYRHVILRSGT
ncbi:MAG: putative glycosyltransferase [Nocardioides sp.]|nr:putative glycosyltransferase [Nocardioides sp.]